jgi:hypothetical protein
LPPRNWRCWNALCKIFQNFPFSETHHFAAVTQSSARPKISQKIGLKTSSEGCYNLFWLVIKTQERETRLLWWAEKRSSVCLFAAE